MHIMIENDLNSDSFESLFKSHFKDLVGYVCSYVNDEEVSKDIVHDVFLVVLKNEKNLDTSYSLKSYLFTLSKNYALNYLKHLQKKFSSNSLFGNPYRRKTSKSATKKNGSSNRYR